MEHLCDVKPRHRDASGDGIFVVSLVHFEALRFSGYHERVTFLLTPKKKD